MVLAFCLIALANPSLGSRWFDRLEQSFSALGRRRGLSVALVGFATLGLRLTLLPLFPVPEPIVHDEYSYLLTADTVAHGRLTNTTHLMWEHFETFDEIQQPTYCSKYFPAQGFFLALGRIVFGHPYWGVWLSSGLMCAAITWMLQGWMPPEWALLGGLLVMLRGGVVGYWADSYWGGAVAAAGGALVLGALPRIKSSQHMRDALLMGIGLGILASSRPYEGLIFSLPIAILLLSWMLARSRSQFKVSLYRIILPIVLVLGVTCAGLGYYSWRTTGAPFRMPYSVATQTYSVAPIMLWQHLRPVPDYHHEVMRKVFTGEEVRYFQAIRSPGGFLLKLYFLFFSSWRFYFGLLFVLPLWMLALALPRNFSWHNVDRSTRTLLLVLASFASGLALATYYSPHYSAPVAGLIWALMLRAMRKVRGWNASG